MRYRDAPIKVWTGIYELDLPEPFFLLAYDSGLGSKNPQGFGMVEVMDAEEAVQLFLEEAEMIGTLDTIAKRRGVNGRIHLHG